MQPTTPNTPTTPTNATPAEVSFRLTYTKTTPESAACGDYSEIGWYVPGGFLWGFKSEQVEDLSDVTLTHDTDPDCYMEEDHIMRHDVSVVVVARAIIDVLTEYSLPVPRCIPQACTLTCDTVSIYGGYQWDEDYRTGEITYLCGHFMCPPSITQDQWSEVWSYVREHQH